MAVRVFIDVPAGEAPVRKIAQVRQAAFYGLAFGFTWVDRGAVIMQPGERHAHDVDASHRFVLEAAR